MSENLFYSAKKLSQSFCISRHVYFLQLVGIHINQHVMNRSKKILII